MVEGKYRMIDNRICSPVPDSVKALANPVTIIKTSLEETNLRPLVAKN